MLPILPVIAADLGADLAMAAFILVLLTLGTVIGNIPAGAIISAIGEQKGMIYSALVATTAATMAAFAGTLWLLGVAVFIMGLSHSMFALARHSFMTSFVPISHRARSLSTLGGSFRAGMFVGPFLTVVILNLVSNNSWVFLAYAALCLFIVVLLLVIPDPTEVLMKSRSTDTGTLLIIDPEESTLWRSFRKYRKAMLEIGIGALIMVVLRATRQVLLPLWAVSIMIEASDTALILGIANSIDFALFYVGGLVMDKYGRAAAALPVMFGISISLIVLSLSHDLPNAVFWFIVCAMTLSLSNGMSSGILMTLSSDLAPKANPAPFLGLFRMFTHTGEVLTPVIISVVTATLSISISAGIIAVIGLFGSGYMASVIGKYDPTLPARIERRRQRREERTNPQN